MMSSRLIKTAALALGCMAVPQLHAQPAQAPSQPLHQTRANARDGGAQARAHPRRQVGKASFYARQFYGRKMANGRPMHPEGDNAASKTLPLGTVARVTNLDNGQSTVVTIEDRGPYVDGRIVDLSPGSAREIGLTPRQGLARVEVVPLRVPGQTVAQTEPDARPLAYPY